MRKLATAMLIGTLCLYLHPAGAASPQQEKMTTCNVTATQKGLKGNERRDFMSQCLSAKAAEGPGNKQQVKMKRCNTEADVKTLKGDARKDFMKQCLSARADHPAG